MNETKDINCDEALKRLFAYLDRELDAHAHREMEQHLTRCRSCFSRTEFEKRLKERLRETGRETAAPEFAARIRRLLGNF